MASELARQREFLDQVKDFVLSVRDEKGEAFSHNIIAAKEDIERMIGTLHSQRSELASSLSDLARATNEFSSTLAAQERALTDLQADISSLDATVAQRRSHVEHAHRASEDMDREVERISAALSTSKKQYRSLRSELDQSLGQLAQYISSVRSDKNILDQQVQQAHFLLRDVTTSIMSLQDKSSHVGDKLADAVGTDVIASDRSTASSGKPNAAATSVQQIPVRSGQDGVAYNACQVLQEALGSFGDVSSSKKCRKAYLNFARKNHPDKGGNTDVFKAVDGLYNLILDAKLLDKKGYLRKSLERIGCSRLRYKLFLMTFASRASYTLFKKRYSKVLI